MLLATAVTPAPGPAPATRDVVPLLLGGCDPGSPINVRPGRVTCVWCGGPTRQPCPRPRPRRLPCPRHADLACVPCVTPTSASGEHPMSAGHSGRGGRGLCPPARLPRVDFGPLPRLPPPHQPRAARPHPPGDPPLPPAGTRPDWSHCPRFQARFPPVRWELLPRSWFPSGSSRELGEVGSRGSQASPPRRCPPGPRSPWARPTSARMPPRDPRSPGHRETAWAGCWFWVTEFRWPLGRRSPQHAVNHLVSSVGRASQGLPGSALGGAWGGLLWHPEGLRVRAPWIKMLRVAPYLSPPGCSVPTSGVNNGRAGGGRRPVSPAAASLP